MIGEYGRGDPWGRDAAADPRGGSAYQPGNGERGDMRVLRHGLKLAGGECSRNRMEPLKNRNFRLCVVKATLRKNLAGQFWGFLAGPLPCIYL